MQAIKIENVTKRYKDVVALDGVSLEVKEGELFSLLGVNGAGKSTLIKILSTLTAKDEGSAYVGGYSVDKDVESVKSIIGVSTQETAVARNLTVIENLKFLSECYLLDNATRDERIKYLSEKLSLKSVLNKKAKTLSGGYQRKLSIALALIGKPKILFLDEPTLGLDVIARRELWQVITELKKDCTVILTTHYLEEAERLSDRIGVLLNGKLVAVDTVQNIISATGTKSLEDAFITLSGGTV